MSEKTEQEQIKNKKDGLIMDWLMEKHRKNSVWAMDIYLKFFAPMCVGIFIYMQQWIPLITIFFVICFLICMRKYLLAQNYYGKHYAVDYVVRLQKCLKLYIRYEYLIKNGARKKPNIYQDKLMDLIFQAYTIDLIPKELKRKNKK